MILLIGFLFMNFKLLIKFKKKTKEKGTAFQWEAELSYWTHAKIEGSGSRGDTLIQKKKKIIYIYI